MLREPREHGVFESAEGVDPISSCLSRGADGPEFIGPKKVTAIYRDDKQRSDLVFDADQLDHRRPG